MKEKYRVGRKIGLVILETETSKEVARATTEEMAKNICELLNHQSKVNNSVLDDVINTCVHQYKWDNPNNDECMKRTCELCGHKDA